MKHRKYRQFNCRIEGCGAGFGSMSELFKHRKKHDKENFDKVMKLLNTERQLATSMTMENARLKSEMLHQKVTLKGAERTLEIIKMLLEPIKFTVGVQVVRSAVGEEPKE